MPYLVRLTGRALRDMEAIYEFIEADASKRAFAWFNVLAETVYSLERFPERRAVVPESKKLRHLLLEKKPSTYRIIYTVGKRNHIVNVSPHPARCEGCTLGGVESISNPPRI
jgi:plasmid stabilization system protein ParE